MGGNAADRALLRSVMDAGGSVGTLPRVSARCPFDSAKKYSACTTADGETYVKGAPEILLPRVSDYIARDGSVRPFGGGRAFGAALSEARRGGGRVLLITVGSGRMSGDIPDSLTLIAAVILNDRLRREAPAAVGELRGAGIHVVMITGDSAETAGAIARESGILGGGVDMVLESSELARLTDGGLAELLPRIGVIARALPSDKSRLVRVAQDAGLVVGMTGDGINDAPALKRADIGFAMGSGTQVAKDAGDIVILDEPILNRYMINQIVFLGVFTVALSLGFLKLPFFTQHFRSAPDGIYLLTAFFAFFIFAGVFNCFNARTDRLRLLAGIRKNPAFITIMSAVLTIQIGFVYLGGTVLRTVPLKISELLWAMAFSLLVFPAEFLRKLLWRLGGRRGGF